MTLKSPVICLVLLSLSQSGMTQTEFEPLVDIERAQLTKQMISISPDNYSMEFNRLSQRTNAKTGGELGLLNLTNNSFDLGLTLSGFLEIRDFRDNGNLDFGMWRGQYQLLTHWQFDAIEEAIGENHDLTFSLGLGHESQHIENQYSYRDIFEAKRNRPIQFASLWDNQWPNTQNPSTPNLSTHGRGFNYYFLSADYLNSVNADYDFHFKTTYKHYYAGYFHRENKPYMKRGFAFETGLNRSISQSFNAYIKGYLEWIQHDIKTFEFDYHKDFQNNVNDQPLTYRKGEWGITWDKPDVPVLNLYFFYTYSNGRQMDFPKIYEGLGWGLRAIL